MTNPENYVKTVDGWALYLTPWQVINLVNETHRHDGFVYEWRCAREKYGILCSGWLPGSFLEAVAYANRIRIAVIAEAEGSEKWPG